MLRRHGWAGTATVKVVRHALQVVAESTLRSTERRETVSDAVEDPGTPLVQASETPVRMRQQLLLAEVVAALLLHVEAMAAEPPEVRLPADPS
jgi:hypothetical protein